jgi:hypothetical protein
MDKPVYELTINLRNGQFYFIGNFKDEQALARWANENVGTLAQEDRLEEALNAKNTNHITITGRGEL